MLNSNIRITMLFQNLKIREEIYYWVILMPLRISLYYNLITLKLQSLLQIKWIILKLILPLSILLIPYQMLKVKKFPCFLMIVTTLSIKIQKEEEYQYIVQQAFPEYLTIITQSATLIIAYIMKKNRWTFRQSINFVKKIRPSVCPNLGFELQLKQYQKQTIGFNKTDNLSKTLVPIKQNIFNLLGDQLSVPRGSFPHINTLGQITTKTKFKPNKFLGIRDRNSYHQNQDLRKSNLMINTLSGYDNKLNFRQTPTQKQKSNTEHKKEDASRKLAKLIYNKNLYNWSSQNKAFQDNQMKTHKNELFKAPNQLLKRK